jgi:hypothetical protein
MSVRGPRMKTSGALRELDEAESKIKSARREVDE